MQNYVYQMSLLLVEISKEETDHSKLLISKMQRLIAQLWGVPRYLQAKNLFKERNIWLSVLEEVAPYAYASQCNRKVKFLFWLVTTPVVRLLAMALLLLPAVIYYFPLFIVQTWVNLWRSLRRGWDNLRVKIFERSRDSLEGKIVISCDPREQKYDEKTMVRVAVASNRNTSAEELALLANDDEQLVRRAVAENNNTPEVVLASLARQESESAIRELTTSNIQVDTSKGMLYLISGYEINSLYPFKKFLEQEGLDDQDFVIFTSYTNLATVFQDTNDRYPIFPIHGSSVVDKDKEIEIYTEVFRNFLDIEGMLSKMQYKGVPIASFMLTKFFTSTAIAAALREALKYCRSINRHNIVFISRGSDVFLDSILRNICEDKENNFNEFHAWKIPAIFDSCADVPIEYEDPEKSSPKMFAFQNVDVRSKKVLSEVKSLQIRDKIERTLTRKSLFKQTRALLNELLNPFYYASAAISHYGKKADSDPIFVVTEADPKSIYWKAVYPVIRSVISKGAKVVVFTGNYSTYVRVRSDNIEAFLLSSNIKIPQNIKMNQESNKLFMELSSSLKFLLASKKLGDFKYCSQKDVYIMFNEIKNRAGMYASFRHSMMLVDLLLHAFEAYKPRSILAMPHASPGPAHAIDIARICGVKSVSMPAVTVDSHRRSIPTNWKTDIIASYGEQSNRAFMDTGHNEESLVLTGNASLDTLLKHELDVSEDEVRTRLGIGKDMKIVLIATSRIDTHEEIWLNEMHNYCERRGDTVMVIKSHPSFDPSTYDKVRQGKLCIVLDDIPIYSLIYASALLVTDYSTTGVEAALVGKPVVVVNLLGKDYPSNNYDQYGVALLIDTLSGVRAAFDPILDGDAEVMSKLKDAQEKFMDDYNYMNDGHAADRIAEILLNPDKYTKQSESRV